MPSRHKNAPPEDQLYAPIEWTSQGDYEDILYERGDSIAKISINRPDVMNAFRPPTLAELRDAFTRARDDIDVGDLHVQIRRLPKPVVAMVAGYAVGGGHILHLVCDLTIAADSAQFGQTGPRVGSFDG